MPVETETLASEPLTDGIRSRTRVTSVDEVSYDLVVRPHPDEKSMRIMRFPAEEPPGSWARDAIRLTPAEARVVAPLLLRMADELEAKGAAE